MKKTIAQIGKENSFEKIYQVVNKCKLDRDRIQKEINLLVKKRNLTSSVASRWNQIALSKRRAIVDKK